MQRYFAKRKEQNNLILEESDIHHIKNVMRMNINDKIEVVYDKNGDYFRINDTNVTGKRSYLDLNGNKVPNNVMTETGTQRGMTQGEYNAVTRFKNID